MKAFPTTCLYFPLLDFILAKFQIYELLYLDKFEKAYETFYLSFSSILESERFYETKSFLLYLISFCQKDNIIKSEYLKLRDIFFSSAEITNNQLFESNNKNKIFFFKIFPNLFNDFVYSELTDYEFFYKEELVLKSKLSLKYYIVIEPYFIDCFSKTFYNDYKIEILNNLSNTQKSLTYYYFMSNYCFLIPKNDLFTFSKERKLDHLKSYINLVQFYSNNLLKEISTDSNKLAIMNTFLKNSFILEIVNFRNNSNNFIKLFQPKCIKKELIIKKIIRKFKLYLTNLFTSKKILIKSNKKLINIDAPEELEFSVDFVTIPLIPPIENQKYNIKFKSFNYQYIGFVFSNLINCNFYQNFIEENILSLYDDIIAEVFDEVQKEKNLSENLKYFLKNLSKLFFV